jgi:hypothetical protein
LPISEKYAIFAKKIIFMFTTTQPRTKPTARKRTLDECPICKAAGYRLKPDVEEAIKRSVNGEGRVAFKSLDELFNDLDS